MKSKILGLVFVLGGVVFGTAAGAVSVPSQCKPAAVLESGAQPCIHSFVEANITSKCSVAGSAISAACGDLCSTVAQGKTPHMNQVGCCINALGDKLPPDVQLTLQGICQLGFTGKVSLTNTCKNKTVAEYARYLCCANTNTSSLVTNCLSEQGLSCPDWTNCSSSN
jgi:hypothetical protein